MKNTKLTREALCSLVVIALTILGILLFALNFSTGYYTFGQLNSKAVLAASIAAALVACAALLLRQKLDKQWWPKLLGFCVTALLAYAAMTLIGDRVEGIGICILTDYDSGHGGEEAIYMSLGASVAWLAAMVFNIIGSFGADEPAGKGGKIGLSAAGAILLAAILIPSLALGGVFAPKAAAPASLRPRPPPPEARAAVQPSPAPTRPPSPARRAMWIWCRTSSSSAPTCSA